MSKERFLRIVNARICLPEGMRSDTDLLICDGRIQFSPPSERISSVAEETIDANQKYVLPAFTDLHNHGAGLLDFTNGRFDALSGEFEQSAEIYRQGLPRYAALMASHGTANVYAALLAAEDATLRVACEQLHGYMNSRQNGQDGAVLKGVFLEGTFLNPSMAGVQNPRFSREPDIELFDRLNREQSIRIANIAPEYGEKSKKLIEYLTDHGITVGAGHTAATARQFNEAVKHGLKYCIHFTNGPMSQSFKPFEGGGAVEAVLTNPEVYVELIPDGYHVSFAYVRDILARKGIGKIFASTDCIFAVCTRNVERFLIAGIQGRVSPDRDCVLAEGRRDYLFASMLTMDRAFDNLLSLLTREVEGVWQGYHPPLDLDQALPAVCRLCSTNANSMLRMHGHADQQTGFIGPDNWADLIIGEIEGEPGQYHLNIERVFVHGHEAELKKRITPKRNQDVC